MRSELQKQTSRINGAKSRGPVTPEGKRISAQNARRGGLLAKTILIDGESPAHFAALLSQLHSEFRPRPGVETALLETMAVCRWRQLRMWGMEAAIVSHEVRRHRDTAHEAGESLSQVSHAIAATRNLTDRSRVLEYIARNEGRLERQYNRAHRTLLDMLSGRIGKVRAIEPGVPAQPIENADDRRVPEAA